jgi:hypothetical protein
MRRMAVPTCYLRLCPCDFDPLRRYSPWVFTKLICIQVRLLWMARILHKENWWRCSLCPNYAKHCHMYVSCCVIYCIWRTVAFCFLFSVWFYLQILSISKYCVWQLGASVRDSNSCGEIYIKAYYRWENRSCSLTDVKVLLLSERTELCPASS